LHRLKLALVGSDFKVAWSDLNFFRPNPAYDPRLTELERELRQEGFIDAAVWLNRYRQVIPLVL
jgi:hypothetical protein